jgi:hypothetical protein
LTAGTTIDEALADPHLLGAGLGDLTSWTAWRVILKATFGLALNRSEARTFAALAGDRKPPRRRVAELWAVASRRSGKSRMAALVATYIAAFIDHRSKLARGEVGYVLVLSPTKAQSALVKSYVEGFFAASPILAQMVETVTADEIRLRGGIVIAVHPASHRTVRGRTLLACVLEEVAFLRDEASATPDLEVYRAVLPALSTTGGMLVGISSPYRRVGLLHQKHRDHFGQDGDVLVIQAATPLLNPTIDPKVIKRAEADDPESAKAEWGGLFREGISSLLDDAVIDGAIDSDRPLELPPREGVSYVAFADASAGRHDAFSICLGHREGDRLIADVIRARRPPFDPNAVAAEYADLARGYRCREIVGDNFAGEFVPQAFKAAGMAYRRASRTRSQLYLESVSQFMRGVVSMPNHPKLIRELRLLERQVSPSGRDRVDHPKGGSDDLSNALVGALDLLSGRRDAPIAVFATYTSGAAPHPLVGRYGPPTSVPTVAAELPAPAWVSHPRSEAQRRQATIYLAQRARA